MIRLLRFHPASALRWWFGVALLVTAVSAVYDVTRHGAAGWQPGLDLYLYAGLISLMVCLVCHQRLAGVRTGPFWPALPLTPAELRRFQLVGVVLGVIAVTLTLPAAMAVATVLGSAVPAAAVWKWLAPLEVVLLWVVMTQTPPDPTIDEVRVLGALAIAGWVGAFRFASPTITAILGAMLLLASTHWIRVVRRTEAGAPWQPARAPTPDWAPDDDGWAEPADARGVFTMAPNALARTDDPGNDLWLLHRLCWREVSRWEFAAFIWPLMLCVGTIWVIAQFGPGRFAASLGLLFFLLTPIRWSLGHTSRLAALPILPRRLFAYAVLPHLCWMAVGTLPILLMSVRADGGDVVFSRTAARSVWILVLMFFGLLVQATGRGALAPLAGTWRSIGRWLIASPLPWLWAWIAIAVLVPPISQPNGTSAPLDAVLINGLADKLPANRLAAFAVVLATAAAGYYVAERRFARNAEAVTYAFDAAVSPEGGRV